MVAALCAGLQSARWARGPELASGIAAACVTGICYWLIGAALMIANWPYAILGILALNNQLNALSPEEAERASRDMLTRRNRLHRVRTILPGLAVIVNIILAT